MEVRESAPLTSTDVPQDAAPAAAPAAWSGRHAVHRLSALPRVSTVALPIHLVSGRMPQPAAWLGVRLLPWLWCEAAFRHRLFPLLVFLNGACTITTYSLAASMSAQLFAILASVNFACMCVLLPAAACRLDRVLLQHLSRTFQSWLMLFHLCAYLVFMWLLDGANGAPVVRQLLGSLTFLVLSLGCMAHDAFIRYPRAIKLVLHGAFVLNAARIFLVYLVVEYKVQPLVCLSSMCVQAATSAHAALLQLTLFIGHALFNTLRRPDQLVMLSQPLTVRAHTAGGMARIAQQPNPMHKRVAALEAIIAQLRDMPGLPPQAAALLTNS